jgi:hypothetical protein
MVEAISRQRQRSSCPSSNAGDLIDQLERIIAGLIDHRQCHCYRPERRRVPLPCPLMAPSLPKAPRGKSLTRRGAFRQNPRLCLKSFARPLFFGPTGNHGEPP